MAVSKVTEYKFHILYFDLDAAPNIIDVPGRRPVTVRGVLRWTVSDWGKEPFELIENKANVLISQCVGKELYEVVEALAEMIKKELPGSNFSVTIGSFGIERKVEPVLEKGG